MVFDWDDGKSERCLRERGFDFDYAARLFEGETEQFQDDREEYRERRFIAFGHIEGLMYAVVYTDRDGLRWIISAFRCRQKELDRWKRCAAER